MTGSRMRRSLPDLLAERLDIVFVGINPAWYSVDRGHYFARATNRFWQCFSRSTLSRAARDFLGTKRLLPEHDRALMQFGFGFTDLVKRPTIRADEATETEFRRGIGVLAAKIDRYHPRIVCFQGISGYHRVSSRRLISFGCYLDVPMDCARARGHVARQLLDLRIDPAERRRELRQMPAARA